MTQIQYPNDVSGSLQIAQGSDGRLNVSSRSDSRAYYNSRDKGQSYSLVFDDNDAAEGEYVVYMQNTSTTLDLVVEAIGLNSTVAGAFKLAVVTGTAAGGSALTPVNLNRSSAKDAAAVCRGDGAVTGLTPIGVVDQVAMGTNAHEEIRMSERLRLGQGDAIAIEFDRTAVGNSIVEGVIFFYYE